MKHEPLDQTNPENRCNVDGVEYVACADAQMTCFACVAVPGSMFCQKLGECSVTRRDRRNIYWRPASEFGPSEADRLREQVKTLRAALAAFVNHYGVDDVRGWMDVLRTAKIALESTKEHE